MAEEKKIKIMIANIALGHTFHPNEGATRIWAGRMLCELLIPTDIRLVSRRLPWLPKTRGLRQVVPARITRAMGKTALKSTIGTDEKVIRCFDASSPALRIDLTMS